MRRNLKRFSDRHLHSLIITQGHVDHLGGVQYLRGRNPGLKVIASAGNPEHQNYDARLAAFRANRSSFAFMQKFADIFGYYQENGYTDFNPQDTPTPDLLVEERHSFELGGLQLQIICVPGAETNDSLIVWLPQHRICFTGNLFGCPFGHFPNLSTIRGDRYRDALVVADAVALVRDLQPELICYGHHGPVAGGQLIQDELNALHGAIVHVHDQVVEGMNAGKTVYQLMADIQLPPDLEVGEGYGKVSWGVRSIWENYSGWFHHQSTTELYSVPQSSIHTDLVELAGGAEVLVERAEEKFAENKPEEAIHLLDILRNASQQTDASRRLYRRIHESLLADSENFWLSSWLKHQLQNPL